MKPLELKGKRFSRLLVLKAVNKNKNLAWLCRCDCGKKCIKRGADLKRGFIKSCGCWNSELTTLRNLTHNMANTNFYKNWQGMKDRCLNPNSSKYILYGGRGIKICDKWLKFENFRADMHKSYLKHQKEFGIGQKNTSLDRINNNGNYELVNCRWATQKEQVNNSRKVLK